MDLFLNLRFLLDNVSCIFSFGHIYLVCNILHDRLWSRRCVFGDILGNGCICCNIRTYILLNTLHNLLSYILLSNRSGDVLNCIIFGHIRSMEQVFEIYNILLCFLDVSLHNFMRLNLLFTLFFLLFFLQLLLFSLFLGLQF